MKIIHTMLLIGAALFSTANVGRTDTIQLKSGAILVGDVSVIEGGDVRIVTRFPREETLTLKREDVMPRSLYDVLDRRTEPGDAEGRLRLGELAETTGLFGLAISDFLAVAELRPDLEREMTARVNAVREAIAERMLDDVRALLEDGNPRSALLYLHTLQEQYPDTVAARKGANELMTTAHERAGASTDVAEKTVPVERAPKVIEGLKKDLEKGDREMQKLDGHEGDSSRDRRAADKAIKYFESAWEDVKSLPVAAPDPELEATIQGLRKSIRQRLVKGYLTAGSIHLQRYSIPRAEEYCNKACELDPENKSNHALHRLIIEAKIYGGVGWGGR